MEEASDHDPRIFEKGEGESVDVFPAPADPAAMRWLFSVWLPPEHSPPKVGNMAIRQNTAQSIFCDGTGLISENPVASLWDGFPALSGSASAGVAKALKKSRAAVRKKQKVIFLN